MSFLNIKKNKEKNKEKNPGHRAGIVCCSNGQPPQAEKTLKKLEIYLSGIGLEPVFTEYIYQKNSVFSGTARQRAESLVRAANQKGGRDKITVIVVEPFSSEVKAC